MSSVSAFRSGLSCANYMRRTFASFCTAGTTSSRFSPIVSPFSSSSSSSSSASASSFPLIGAHGPTGQLVHPILHGDALHRAKDEVAAFQQIQSFTLSRRQLCDVEMILNGAFSPLDGFMTKAQYESVVHQMRLPVGQTSVIYPMPITLDVTDKQAADIAKLSSPHLALRDEEGTLIAILDISDVWKINKDEEANVVFGGDPEHPAIHFLRKSVGTHYVGGKLRGLRLPPHSDDVELRHSPAQVRKIFADQQWKNVVAFQTRNPLHRAHFELTLRAMKDYDAKLLLHPVVGMTKPGDIDALTRVKCYKTIMGRYEKGTAMLSLLPLAMRMAGPREAVFHAIIRQNYGANYFIIGRDHAGPGSNSAGKDFYGPYEARDFALAKQKELNIKLLPFDMMVYVEKEKKYFMTSEVEKSWKVEKLSGTEVRKRLQTGSEIPDWFSFPEIVRILRQAYRPNDQKGFCVFLTGLSGSGKSTIANGLQSKLLELDNRQTIILDGDLVRKWLSSELGFSREHRNLNISRIGHVAALLVRCGAAVICCPIAPYEEGRKAARQAVESEGGRFMEVWVSTPFDACEARDTKAFYRQARAGLRKNFTGLDDPYEAPTKHEYEVDTSKPSGTGEEPWKVAVDKILGMLKKEGFLTEQK